MMLRADRLARTSFSTLLPGESLDTANRHEPSDSTAEVRRAARTINPPSRSVDRAFFQQESFRRLSRPVQTALRALLAMVPDRAPDVQRLMELDTFGELSAAEQRALLTPPKPDRLDHALALLEHPVWPALRGDKLPLLGLDARVQTAVVGQLHHFLTSKTGEYLCRLAVTPWFGDLKIDDQIRAAKVIAYAASTLTGASFEDQGVSQRKIIENTLESLVSPDPRFKLEFEDLPFEEDNTIAGHRELPGTVVLNRLAIPADDARVHGRKQEHVALATLVHEINHLCNQVPDGPTYAAFQDEYRAWFVSAVAFLSRFPTQMEALTRLKELFTSDAYTDIQQALADGGPESEQILRFMQSFGPVRSLEDIFALELTNFVVGAPLPDPMLEMNNGAV